MVIASINTSGMILVEFWDDRLKKDFAEKTGVSGGCGGLREGGGLGTIARH